MPVLVWVEPCQISRSGLTATRLSNIGLLEKDALRSQLVENWGLDEGLAVTAQFGSVVFRNDEQNVGSISGEEAEAGTSKSKNEGERLTNHGGWRRGQR